MILHALQVTDSTLMWAAVVYWLGSWTVDHKIAGLKSPPYYSLPTSLAEEKGTHPSLEKGTHPHTAPETVANAL